MICGFLFALIKQHLVIHSLVHGAPVMYCGTCQVPAILLGEMPARNLGTMTCTQHILNIMVFMICTMGMWILNNGQGRPKKTCPLCLKHLQQCSICDLAKTFLTSKFSYLLFPHRPIKLGLGLQKGKRLLIAKHLDQSF